MLAGCDNVKKGLAPLDGVVEEVLPEEEEQAAEPAVAVAPPNPLPGAGEAAAPQEEVKPFERVFDLVDKNVAMAENPNWQVTDNSMNASDPWTAAAGAYFSAASRVHVSALKHEVDLMEALHGRKPTYAEFKAALDRSNVKLKGLYPWQVYAYDDQSGEIVVLTDPVAEDEARGR